MYTLPVKSLRLTYANHPSSFLSLVSSVNLTPSSLFNCSGIVFNPVGLWPLLFVLEAIQPNALLQEKCYSHGIIMHSSLLDPFWFNWSPHRINGFKQLQANEIINRHVGLLQQHCGTCNRVVVLKILQTEESKTAVGIKCTSQCFLETTHDF